MRARSACICWWCPYFDDGTPIDHADPPPPSLGALYANIDAQIDDRLSGKAPESSLLIYSTQDHTTPIYVRNVSNWAADIVQQLTPISPWNSDDTIRKAGILISPRHALFASHYLPAASSTIRFVAVDGTITTRTISTYETIPDTGVLYPDLTIGLLDSDVPGSISFAKVLPVAAAAKLPPINTAGNHLPSVSTDQEEKLLVRNWTNFDAVQAPTARCNFQEPFTSIGDDPLRDAFYENFVGGDSGSPLFVFINDEIVLLALNPSVGDGYGASIAAFKTEINAAMTTLGGGYQLTEADLSMFPDL